MFEDWPVTFNPAPRRIVEPPLPVTVDVAAAIRQPGNRPMNELPLRVRAEGLALDVRVPGQLLAWARTTGGSWICLLHFAIPAGNGCGHLTVTQWCASDAATPTQP